MVIFLFQNSQTADKESLREVQQLTVVGIMEQADFATCMAGDLFYCLPSRASPSYDITMSDLAALSAALGTIRSALVVTLGLSSRASPDHLQDTLAALYPLTLTSLGLRRLHPHSPFTPAPLQQEACHPRLLSQLQSPFPLTSLSAILPMSKVLGNTFSPLALQSKSVLVPPPTSQANTALQINLDAALDVYLAERMGGGDASRETIATKGAVQSIFSGAESKEAIFRIIQEVYLSILRSREVHVTELLDSFQGGLRALEVLQGGEDTSLTPAQSFLQFLCAFIMMNLKSLEKRYEANLAAENELEVERIKFRE